MTKLLTTKHTTRTLCYRVRAAAPKRLQSQRAFAAKLGVEQKTISNWEAGVKPNGAAQTMLKMLAKQYKVPL